MSLVELRHKTHKTDNGLKIFQNEVNFLDYLQYLINLKFFVC